MTPTPSPLSLPLVRVNYAAKLWQDRQPEVDPSDLARAIEIVADARVDEAVRQLGRQLAEIHAHASGNVDLHAGRLADIIDVWLASRSPREAGQDGPQDDWPPRCPKCNSPDPKRHPAVQFEGEVQICDHPFHTPEPGQDGGRDTVSLPAVAPEQSGSAMGQTREQSPSTATPSEPAAPAREVVDKIVADLTRYSEGFRGLVITHLCKEAADAISALQARVRELEAERREVCAAIDLHGELPLAKAVAMTIRCADDTARAAGFRECQEKSIIDADTVRASLAQHGRLYESDGAAEVIKVLRSLTPPAGSPAREEPRRNGERRHD